jgi:monovalent cation/proton antiporter MnhG/PhaG subunit
MSELIGSLFLLGGAVFLFSAGVGVLRMPDTYNRIQTGTKATTLGTILILIGLAFLARPGACLARYRHCRSRIHRDRCA